MNTKEIAEAIDELIKIRVEQGTSVVTRDWDKVELLKRKIADGIREYSGVQGVAVDNTRDEIYHRPKDRSQALNPL